MRTGYALTPNTVELIPTLGALFPRGGPAIRAQFKNNCFTEVCSGSEAGSYLRFIDFVYHSTLGLRVIKKKREDGPGEAMRCEGHAVRRVGGGPLKVSGVGCRV